MHHRLAFLFLTIGSPVSIYKLSRLARLWDF